MTIPASRMLGLLILAQIAAGVLTNFVLTTPSFDDTAFLVTAAPHASQIGLSALFGIAAAALFLALAITAYPVFRLSGQGLALWLVTLAVVTLSIAVLEHLSEMSMVSLSESWTRATTAERDHFQAVAAVVMAARRWSHYMGRLSDGCVLLVFFAGLYRAALIPRALAAIGLLAVMLQLTALAMPFVGRPVIFPLLAPLGLTQLVLAFWLIFRGFSVAGDW